MSAITWAQTTVRGEIVKFRQHLYRKTSLCIHHTFDSDCHFCLIINIMPYSYKVHQKAGVKDSLEMTTLNL